MIAGRSVALLWCAGWAVLAASGCGRNVPPSAPSTISAWSNPSYHLTASYPAGWKVNATPAVEDPKTRKMTVALFNKPDSSGTGEVQQRPPYVKISWTPNPPGASVDNSAPEQGPTVLGVPASATGPSAGWVEFGAEKIKTRHLTWPGNVPAEEATAAARPGTAFFSTYTNQLAGTTHTVRVVELKLTQGTYEIERVAPDSPAGLAHEADQIVDSLRFTK